MLYAIITILFLFPAVYLVFDFWLTFFVGLFTHRGFPVLFKLRPKKSDDND